MLHEIKAVKQEPGAGRRRWFESDGLDLVVWFDPAGAVSGFQLCYDFGSGEHALTWRQPGGFAHSWVDAGEDGPFRNATPVLEPDGPAPWRELSRLFAERSQQLEAPLRTLVQAQLAARAASG